MGVLTVDGRSCARGAMLALALAAACGGDDGGGQSQPMPQPVMQPPATTTPPTNTTTAGTMAQQPAIDPMQVMDLIDMFLPDCDPAVPTTATCGGVACPAQNAVAAAACIVPCCAQGESGEECGTRSSDVNMPDSTCTLPPPPGVEDPLCPSFDTGMSVLPGCCTENAVCGVISSISGACITQSQFIQLPPSPPPCDGSGLPAAGDGGMSMGTGDAGTADAGTSDAGTADAGTDAGI